jgi:hypothetical protein
LFSFGRSQKFDAYALAQISDERHGWQAIENFAKETEHNEPLSDFGLDAAALKIETLLVIYRTNRAGMTALDVICFDLKIWNTLSPCTI